MGMLPPGTAPERRSAPGCVPARSRVPRRGNYPINGREEEARSRAGVSAKHPADKSLSETVDEEGRSAALRRIDAKAMLTTKKSRNERKEPVSGTGSARQRDGSNSTSAELTTDL